MSFARYFANRIVLKNNKRISKLSVYLAVVTISLGIIVIEVASSITTAFETEVSRKIIGFIGDIEISTYYNYADDTIKGISINDLKIKKITLEYPEVVGCTPFIKKEGLLKSIDNMEGVQVFGVHSSWDSTFYKNSLIEGKIPNLFSKKYSKEILISQSLSNNLNLKTGDEAKLFFMQRGKLRLRNIKICGIYKSGMAEFDQLMVISDIRLLQRILHWDENEAQGFQLFIDKSHKNIDSLAKTINQKIHYDQEALSANQRYPELFSWLELQHQHVFFILILMVVVAIINMSTALIIMISERTATIGILLAMGASSYNIRSIFIWQAFYLISLGIGIGNIISFILLFIQDLTGLITLDESSYFVTEVPISWVWDQFLIINIIVIIVCTLAMYLPTIIIEKIKPVKALKNY